MIRRGAERYLRPLLRALKKLEPAQGRIARRNARRRVFAALTTLRRQVDEDWPGERRQPKERKKLTPQQRARRLEDAGWAVVASLEVLSRITSAGIRVRRVQVEKSVGGSGYPKGGFKVTRGVDTFAPKWAITIAAAKPSKLAAARASVRERKATLTEIALGTKPSRGPDDPF